MKNLIIELLTNKKARETTMLSTLVAITLIPGEPWL